MSVASNNDNGNVPRRGGNRQDGTESRNVGDALRAVYHDAVSESVPDELLELLKKLD